MFRKILSNQVGHGTIDDMRQFPVAECDKKHIHKGCTCMPETAIVDPADSQEIDFSTSAETHSGGEQLPDSGARREFSTGSVRDVRTGKGRYDLISPIAMASLAKRLEDGMTKYGVRNWEKGQNLMSYLDSCLRHINRFITDAMTDRVSEEDHISAAFWNLHSFIHTQYMIMQGSLPAELDDIPTPRRVFGSTASKTIPRSFTQEKKPELNPEVKKSQFKKAKNAGTRSFQIPTGCK